MVQNPNSLKSFEVRQDQLCTLFCSVFHPLFVVEENLGLWDGCPGL